MSRSLICSKHDPTEWTRHRADSEFIAGDQPGFWFCRVCHPPAPALLPFLERFDLNTHAEHLDTKVGSVAVYTETDRMAVTRDEAAATFARWRDDDDGWVKARVLTLARLRGQFHVDDMPDVGRVSWAVQALSRAGLVEKLNSRGEVERRGTTYVWRLSATGRAYAQHLRRALGNTDRLPGPRKEA